MRLSELLGDRKALWDGSEPPETRRGILLQCSGEGGTVQATSITRFAGMPIGREFDQGTASFRWRDADWEEQVCCHAKQPDSSFARCTVVFPRQKEGLEDAARFAVPSCMVAWLHGGFRRNRRGEVFGQ